MRILVLQLARLGDIYLTWPVLKGLKRKYPQASIELVVRKRFAEAAKGLEIDAVHIFDTGEILAPALKGDQNAALKAMDQQLMPLYGCDKVINLTYSPLSSYITHMLSNNETDVVGYSRHSDGQLHPVDDISAYFMAQGGVGSENQIHLLKIFGATCGLDLEPQDFEIPLVERRHRILTDKKIIAIQPFASRSDKSLSVTQWGRVIDALDEYQVVLLGSKEDEPKIAQLMRDHTISFAGQLELQDNFDILNQSDLLIAPDSVFIHMASLTNTPIVNLSFSTVNSYETGPWTERSRLVFSDEPEFLNLQHLIETVKAEINNEPQNFADQKKSYALQVIEAIYFNSPFPISNTSQMSTAYLRLTEVLELALEQCTSLIKNPHAPEPRLILQQVDELFLTICQLEPQLDVIKRWYQVELMRIKPQSFTDLLLSTQNVYKKVLNICECGAVDLLHKGAEHGNAPLAAV